MNITDNLTRIKEGKDNIIKSLKNKGVEINDNTLINEIPTIIDNAEIGGGGDTPSVPTELVPKYDGASVFRIEVPNDNYEFAINLCNDASTATYDVDWGDGVLESGLTTDEQHHTYSKAGTYDVNIYNISKNITLGGTTSISGISSVTVYFLFNNTNNDIWGGRYIENKDNTTVTNVLIGDNVTSIGSSAFQSCSSLQSIVIPESVTSIGSSAFQSCSSLQSIVIPEGVTSIYNYAFQYCSSLQSVVIPEGVTSINSYAFQYCSSLQSIVIPESVTSINSYAFQYCSSLQSVVIPEGVTSIASNAFQYCSSLQSVVIPEGVTSIYNYAFQYCSSLQSVVIPEGVTSIYNYAFQYCSSLQSIVIPESVTSINSYAFSYCSSLQSVVIPEGVTSIASNAFSQCSSLQSIILESLTAPTIQSNSFPTSGFKYSKRYLYVPKESSGYDSGNFKTYLIDKGWELRYIEDREKTPTTLKLKTTNNFFHNLQAIGQANLIDYKLINDEYIYNFDDKIIELIQYTFYNTVLEEIELPEGVEVLNSNLFSNGLKLSKVNIPSTVTSIGESCFYRNPITELTIPEGITSLPESMCDSCNLNTINIPSTVTSIGSRCFMYNRNLKSINCKAMTAPTIQSDTFSDIATSGTRVLRVPEGAEGYDTWLSQLKGFTLEYFKL